MGQVTVALAPPSTELVGNTHLLVQQGFRRFGVQEDAYKIPHPNLFIMH